MTLNSVLRTLMDPREGGWHFASIWKDGGPSAGRLTSAAGAQRCTYAGRDPTHRTALPRGASRLCRRTGAGGCRESTAARFRTADAIAFMLDGRRLAMLARFACRGLHQITRDRQQGWRDRRVRTSKPRKATRLRGNFRIDGRQSATRIRAR